MSKGIVLIAITAAVAFFDTTANAQYRRDRGPDTVALTPCPAGTCGPIGRRWARAINLCTAANCKKN